MSLSILDRGAPDGDPIDAQLSQLGAAPARLTGHAPWYTRLGIGWTLGTSPLFVLLIGAALGPRGLAVLTPGVLAALDPAVPVALAALGVHVALHLELDAPRRGMRRIGFEAAAPPAVTAAAVTVGILLLLAPDPREAPFHAWLVALASGVCAGLSSPWTSPLLREGRTRSEGLAFVLPIVLGGLLLAWVREGSLLDAWLVLIQMTALPLMIAAAAWLLLSRASETEQRIFALAALLLVGGLADYLSLSSLFAGLVAGLLWRIAGGSTREPVARDVGYLRHPLAVFVLLLAGARMTTADRDAALVFAYPLLAIVGGLLAEVFIWRTRRPADSTETRQEPLAPGVFAVAFALTTVRAAGPQADVLLPVVCVGTMVLQLFAAARRESRAIA